MFFARFLYVGIQCLRELSKFCGVLYRFLMRQTNSLLDEDTVDDINPALP